MSATEIIRKAIISVEELERIPVMPDDDEVGVAAKLLDKVNPDWAGQIDTSVLDMGPARTCILGQGFAYTNGDGYYMCGWSIGEERMKERLGIPGWRELDKTNVFRHNFYRDRWIEEVEKRR